jgi:molybdopterin converting factor small subunit
MATINFTYALKRFYPDLCPIQLSGNTVMEIIEQLDATYPGIRDYIVDERGRLRQHVNIFIGNDLVKDRTSLKDCVQHQDEIYIMQALSGG